MVHIKLFNIINQTYYFFNDMINTEDFKLTKNRQEIIQKY